METRVASQLWSGVYPAATTQFAADDAVDIEATQRVLTALVDDGVDGLVILGTCGENNSLLPEEKRAVMKAATEAVGGRVPLVAGVSELGTGRAVEFARDAEAIGMDALMVLPAMVYVPRPAELEAHFRAVAGASALPCMLYNNPIAYGTDVVAAQMGELAEKHANLHAVKESGGDVRRVSTIRQLLGDRLNVLVGMDDMIVESVGVGATGWIAAGRPAWDPVTRLITLDGVTYGQGMVAGSTTPITTLPAYFNNSPSDGRSFMRIGGPGEAPYLTLPTVTNAATPAAGGVSNNIRFVSTSPVNS